MTEVSASMGNNNKARHEMWMDFEGKVFHIDLYGFYGVDDAEQFFVDYEKHTSQINKKDYHIVINCQNLSTFRPDILPYLKEAYKGYAEFKAVHFVNPPTPTGKMQLKRIAKEVNLHEQFIFVDSSEELRLN